MALNRTRLPWTSRLSWTWRLSRALGLRWTGRNSAAGADASFFEGAAKWRPRPDSLEVSVFTPAEEAESHRRWKGALFRERFRGPVSEAERLGIGLSAAALAALAAHEQASGVDDAGEVDELQDD